MNPPIYRRTKNGFALVATLSVAALITILVMGLLSLAQSSSRRSGQEKARAEAQANARLSLALAIGALQKEMGPDQRISANGGIVSQTDVRHPNWMGVWNSWKAGKGETSQHSTIDGVSSNGMAPTYQPGRNDYFRSWLLSLNAQEARDWEAPAKLALDGQAMPTKDDTAVRLVGEGTLGTPSNTADSVSARLLSATATGNGRLRSRFAWWVGDESQKAALLTDSYDQPGTPLTVAQTIARSQAPASTGTKIIKGLEKITLQDDAKLSTITSPANVDLLDSASKDPSLRPSLNFHTVTSASEMVLADVREGGLKRDLSILLERPIDIREASNDFMLYKFNTKDSWVGGGNQEAVPIQDLAAYYQLYNGYDPTRPGGVRYSSNVLGSGIQIVSPQFGTKSGYDAAFARQYTTLYRQPFPVKLQFLLSFVAEEISPRPTPTASNPKPPTHMLHVGVTPSMTLWNPLNIPLVMNFNGSDPNRNAQLMRMGTLPLTIRLMKDNGFSTGDKSLTWFAYGSQTDAKAHLFNLFFSGKRPIRFEPGEVKTFSLPYVGDVSNLRKAGDQHINQYMDEFFFKTDKFYEGHEVVEGWEPRSFMWFNRSADNSNNPQNTITIGSGTRQKTLMVFHRDERISFEVKADKQVGGDGYTGAPVFFKLIQANHQCYTQYGGTAEWFRHHYVFNSRNRSGDAFTKDFTTKGFPSGTSVITAAPRMGSSIIARAATHEGWPFLQYSMLAGVETNEASNGGIAGGRQFPSRPFLHSSVLNSVFLDDYNGRSLYNSGWNWSISEINDIFEAPVQVSPGNQGYFGGGNTPEYGTTHVVQQEIPVVPPVGIAGLSHARLGGFSIADQISPATSISQVVTATGQAGLFPQTLQAIGNSYAHPFLRPDQAFDPNFQRTFNVPDGARSQTLADHSYLANKALWDEFFFSSITPQPAAVEVFGSTAGRTSEQVASDFFFSNQPLLNRRMVAVRTASVQTRLSDLFKEASIFGNNYQGSYGLADKIGAYLRVQGGFNVNSTSVEAWKIFLSSLRGKAVAYLDKTAAMNGRDPSLTTPDGTPTGQTAMRNGESFKGSTLDPSAPEQWTAWRELEDKEIEELAEAMVKQVKLRGPFLSLSEFVNRRLDAKKPELAAKGAMQAALDDPLVSINAGFRTPVRNFSSAEVNAIGPVFEAAAKGPVAYGSPAYVDQADILRNFSEQLAPRGDTFVIRAYSDALDAGGRVVARVWCEAIVQRDCEYFDSVDAAYLKQADLQSQQNRLFGRKIRIIRFRWLDPSEV